MQIKELNPDELAEVYKEHMKRDFPANELRPFKSIKKLLRQGLYECIGLYDEGELSAYACFVRSSQADVVLLDYYAVIPGQRSRGVGGRFLNLLTERMEESGIIIEVESVGSAQNDQERRRRERRVDFYKRCGARLTNVSGRVFNVDYSVMYLPVSRELSDEAVLGGILEIYRNIAPARLLRRFLHYAVTET